MKKTWWRVPVYCLAAGWVCFQLEVRLLLRFAMVTLPDGSISADNVRSLIVSGILFLAVLLIGGLVFFRRISRRELLVSALVMVALNAVMNLLAVRLQGMFGVYWAMFSEWSGFVSSLLYQLKLGIWPAAAISWLTPLLFVPFGNNTVNSNKKTSP